MDRKMKLTFRYSSGLKERMYLRYRSASASSSTTTGAIKEQPQQPYRQIVYAFGAYIPRPLVCYHLLLDGCALGCINAL